MFQPPAKKPVYTSPPADSPVTTRIPHGSDWLDMEEQLKGRSSLFEAAHKRLGEYVRNDEVRFRLAATDAFVEKAQHRLGVRALTFGLVGIITAIAALALLLRMAYIVHDTNIVASLGARPTTYAFVLLILRSLTVGGFVGGAAYFLVALTKALFHEATVLVTRRHSLRFGRLCLYLHDGQLDTESLLKIFRWSDEFASAFLSLRAEDVKGGPIKIVEQVPPMLESMAKVIESTKAAAPKT